MNRPLVTLIVILTVGMLAWQQFFVVGLAKTIDSEVIAIEGYNLFRVLETSENPLSKGAILKRGETLKTTDTYAMIRLGTTNIALSERTEIQLIREQENGSAEIKLLGGRIASDGPIFVDTPWIDAWSNEPLSVVNYSFDARAQILPLGASAYVDNNTLPNAHIILPIEWDSATQGFTTDNKPFVPSASAEAEFYEWFESQL